MKRWKKWELALLLGLCAALVWGAWAAQRQDALARKMIRLHVIANSDSDADQALKLKVRDKVLDFTTNVLQRSENMEDAQRQLQDALGRIENIARREIVEQGYEYPVTAQLTSAEFPLKEYDGFSLPAGEYTALRLVIGDGAGQNWWCVVYPTAVYRRCRRPAADRCRRRNVGRRSGTYHGRKYRLCAEIPFTGAVGAAAAMAGKAIKAKRALKG